MARERMAKLIKYGHFEGHTGHIIINFMIISNFASTRQTYPHRFLRSLPSDEHLELTVRSAMLQSIEKKLPDQN